QLLNIRGTGLLVPDSVSLQLQADQFALQALLCFPQTLRFQLAQTLAGKHGTFWESIAGQTTGTINDIAKGFTFPKGVFTREAHLTTQSDGRSLGKFGDGLYQDAIPAFQLQVDAFQATAQVQGNNRGYGVTLFVD